MHTLVANTTLDLLPPVTPLSFLSPIIAYRTSIVLYVLVSSLTLLIWDVVENISADIHLLFQTRINLTTLAYFGARIGSLAYMTGLSIFQTAPIGTCSAGEIIPNLFYPVALSCSALLSFFRVRAVYEKSRVVSAFFLALWLFVVGCTLLIPITVRGGLVKNTQYCEDTVLSPFSFLAATWAPVIHDTVVFLAISLRLARNARNIRDGLEVAVLGRYLPAFNRNMLQDGQKYYLISLVTAVVGLLMSAYMSVPLAYQRAIATSPNMVLTTIMACRVYRKTKFGGLSTSDGPSESINEATDLKAALPQLPFHNITLPPLAAAEKAQRKGSSDSSCIPHDHCPSIADNEKEVASVGFQATLANMV